MASNIAAEMESSRKGTAMNQDQNDKHERQDELSDVAEATPPIENCGLSYPVGENGLNSLLEEKCLATWKTCELSIATLRADQLVNPTLLQVLPTPESMLMMEWVLCPPQVHEEGAGDVNPFPAKSLVVATYQSVTSGYAQLNESYKLMRVVSYFSNYGHHITSLILYKLTLSPETMQNMLAATPQLKALTFDGVRVDIDLNDEGWQPRRGRPWIPLSSSSHFPPLPQLEHVRILDTKTTDSATEYWQTLFDWILEPYAEQLVTLDFDGTHGFFSSFQLQPFPLLKRFSVWKLGYYLPSLNHPLPKVESVYIGQFQLDRYKFSRSLESLQNELAALANQLIELHLDVLRNTSDELEELWTLFHYQPSEKWLVGKKWSARNLVFSKLTTFATLFPKYAGEVETLKDMLGCMPNLEELILLRFKEESEDRQEATQEDIANARDHVHLRKYWVVCPKLKKITVRMGVCSKNVVFKKMHPTLAYYR